MSDRANALATQFEQLSRTFITTFEGLEPHQLQEHCAGEQCTVAALGAHVAKVHSIAADWIQMLASDQPLPDVTMAMIDQANATQFAEDATCPQADVLEALQRNGAQAARLVRGLSDDELDRRQYFSLFGSEVTTEGLVRDVLLGDIESHLATLTNLAAAAPAMA
jgi:hypothetical protein